MTPVRQHGQTTGPAAFEELVTTLQERLPTLSESQRRLAQRVMADPEGVAFMTITEMAQSVEVNESTVVRFANSLGLKGYPALARLCQERLREQAQLLRRFQGAAALTSQPEDALQLTTSFDQANLTRTFSRVDPEGWEAAVAALAEARRVHVLGMRKCFAVSYLFGYLLGMVRDDVDILTNNGGNLVDELRRVDADDCFVAVSIHRYSADTVRAFRWAAGKGATTLTLTDNPGSPLAAGADHTFFADTTGIAVLRSLTSFTALVQALANAVAARLGPDARRTLTDEEELLDHFLVYDPEQLGGRW
jgi:DNA-binding MurR/RpiR family transcriptional regulator